MIRLLPNNSFPLLVDHDMADISEVPPLLESEDLLQLRDLFKQAPIGILRTTFDGHILFVNLALANMLGYETVKDFSSSASVKITDFYEDSTNRQQKIGLIRGQNDSPLHIESRWQRKDGSVFPCRLHVRRILDEDGKVKFFEGFVEDISEQKDVEEALISSGERYRSVFENTGTGTIIIEKDTTISFANSGFAKLIGFSKYEIEGKMKWPEVIANDTDLKKMLKYHNKRRDLVNNPPIEYEFTLKDRGGILKDVFLRVDMISGTDCSVASLLDITSHKLAKRNFRESQSRLTDVIEAFEGYIYICSSNHELVHVNSRLEKAMGTEDANNCCYKRIYGLDTPCSYCCMGSVFQGAVTKYEFQNPKDNRWYFAVSSPVYEDEDVVSHKQTVLIDIHERKLAEIALKERELYLQKENLRLRENIQDRYRFGAIVGKSKCMQNIYEQILRAAATDANVILYGESGTGKELVAREIHNLSDRKGKRFLPVNCGAIPGELMESEFFGYRKGAFTGADQNKGGYFSESEHGTLFLDELGEIGESMQVKLLRVLEGNGFTPLGSVEPTQPDVRIISATNSNLRPMLEKGAMREDFFYRIHIIPLNLPPLRDRLDDIPLLVEHFMVKHGRSTTPRLRGSDLDKLMQHDWPGNVRELENTILRFINLNVLEFIEIKGESISPARVPNQAAQATSIIGLKEAAQQFEKKHILLQLEACRWNRTRTAEILGIERKTLYLKMKQFNIFQDLSC